MRHLTLVPDQPEQDDDPIRPDVRWLTNPTGDEPILTED